MVHFIIQTKINFHTKAISHVINRKCSPVRCKFKSHILNLKPLKPMENQLFCKSIQSIKTDLKIAPSSNARKIDSKHDQANRDERRVIKPLNKNCVHYGKSLMRTLSKDYAKVCVYSVELCDAVKLLRCILSPSLLKPKTK